jgi:hypothetical protein
MSKLPKQIMMDDDLNYTIVQVNGNARTRPVYSSTQEHEPPMQVYLTHYNDPTRALNMPEPGETLDKIVYDDLIRAIYDTIDSPMWAAASFRSYREMVMAQRYLLGYFPANHDRRITTRTNGDLNILYVRMI